VKPISKEVKSGLVLAKIHIIDFIVDFCIEAQMDMPALGEANGHQSTFVLSYSCQNTPVFIYT